MWCVVVCDLETSRIGAPYIYDISNLRVNTTSGIGDFFPGHQTVPCALGSAQPLKTDTRIFLGVKTAGA